MADAARPTAPLVLGSGSPRRRDLLARLGVTFEVSVTDVDERALWTGDVGESAIRSAEAKYRALRRSVGVDRVLLTADTMVADAGRVLGKPRSAAEARRMLRSAAGSALVIATGLVLGRGGGPAGIRVVETTVAIKELTDQAIEEYLATGVALDKAGALELQGAAAGFVESIEGCWSNVVGLPICAVAELLDLDPVGASQAERCLGRWCGAAGDR